MSTRAQLQSKSVGELREIASAAGIDAAAPLVDIARARTPEADVRVGSMFELPWGDETFDAVTAINGIWGGCEAAVEE